MKQHLEKLKRVKSFAAEFGDFLKKYQVIGLAVAFIIGAAATKLVTATVNDLVMPVISAAIPGGDWRQSALQVGPIKFLVGDWAGAVIDFGIIAFVIFTIVKFVMKEDVTQKR